ncbi:MAG: sugar phosphate nucleotidyltransferase, partial [Planctomycetota bacterium]|nr:sugar phosphate nucleotidyltransferase [Planctomycetota bacterium]
MKTVILCGGKGTRIRGAAGDMPKPLLNIAGVPLVVRLMQQFSTFGHNSFVLCLGHRADEFKDFFASADLPQDWQVELLDTGENSMTGSRLWQTQNLVGDNFFLCYGDTLSDVDINQLLDFHLQHEKVATLTAVNPRSDYGMLKIGDGDLVEHFHEKSVQFDQWINGGFFVLSKRVFDYLDDDQQLVFERRPLERL